MIESIVGVRRRLVVRPLALRLERVALAAILVVYLALATCYNALIPLGEGPDEAGHMAYVLFLTRNARLPDQNKGTAGEVPGEGHQPPLAYALMTPAAKWLPGRTRRVVLTPDPGFVWNDGSGPAAYSRGSQEYWPWQGVPLAWHLARGVSALLGVISLLGVWGFARALCPGAPGLALLAAVLVAFNPQFLFASGLVSNDPLLIALASLLLWACAHALRGGRLPLRLPPALAIGGLLGLALITKQSALLLAPVAALALVLPPLAGSWAARARNLLALGLICAALAGWWYLRNWQLYGDPLGLKVFASEFRSEPFDWREPRLWLSGLGRLHASFWGYFGWLTVPLPAWAYWLIGGVELLALGGLLRARWARAEVADFVYPLVLLPILMVFAWTLSFALTAGQVAWQGRFLFPALPAFALLLTWGLRAWGGWLAGAALAGLLALAALSPWVAIRPTYSWHTLPARVALDALGTAAYARFADDDRLGIELRGWSLDPQPLVAGESAQLQLTWHARTRIANDWTVFVHLIDSARGDEIAFVSDRLPLDGALPTSQWTPGDWVQDRQTLNLPAELAPGRYILRVGLFDQATGRRAPFFDDDDTKDVEGNSFDLGTVQVVSGK